MKCVFAFTLCNLRKVDLFELVYGAISVSVGICICIILSFFKVLYWCLGSLHLL